MTAEKTREIKSLVELRSVAEAFLHNLLEQAPRGKACVVGLSGDLGAGKTAFTKCIASILGINEHVTSPTFILEKVYIIPRDSMAHHRFAKFIHIDAYRLNSGEEMKALNPEVLFADEQSLVFIEWPEQVASALPKDMVTLSFSYVDEGVRKVSGELI